MSVTLQLSRMADIVSDLIADFTRAWPSHVDIVMPSGMLLGARSDVCMGVPAGVQFRPDGYAPFTKVERISLPATYAQALTFHVFVSDQAGKPYDKIGIVGLAVGRNWRSPDKWFCSELAMAALEYAGIISPITSPVNFISPRDVLMVAEAMQVRAAA